MTLPFAFSGRFALLVASLATPVGAAPLLADVPLQLKSSDRPWVSVQFNRREPVLCALDTGSNVGLVNNDLAQGAESAGRANVTVASGHVPMQQVRMRDVKVGDAALHNVAFFVRERSWADPAQAMPCVLGASFLDNFTVDMDMPARRLRLYTAGTRLDAIQDAPAERFTLRARVSAGNLRTVVLVDDQPADARFDTGWVCTGANAAMWKRLPARLTNAAPDPWPIQIGALPMAYVTPCRDETDTPLMRRERGPYVHLGPDVLSHYRLIIDAKNDDVALVPTAEASE